jgi:hypothetical protein
MDWRRLRTCGALLWMRRWRTFGFLKLRGISCLDKDPLSSQEGLCSVELVSQKSCISLDLIFELELNIFVVRHHPVEAYRCS